MKKKISESLTIPEGVECQFESRTLTCKKGDVSLSRKIGHPSISIKIENKVVTLECQAGNKKDYKIIKTYLAHVKNIFLGVEEKFLYKLESVNVHFPMSLKAEGDKLTITNFLGEKTPRVAKILPEVEVKVSGSQITITSNNKEAAGQTAANMEKATFVKGRDRRIFQDGLYITEKPGAKK